MMLRQLMLDTWNILEMCKLGKVMRPFPAAVLRQVGGKRFVSGCFRMVSELQTRIKDPFSLVVLSFVVDVSGMPGMSCKDYVQKNPHVGAKDGNHELAVLSAMSEQ